MRVGNGYDVHRFAAGGTLRLGGVEIEEAPALEGHSDGDALIHAVIDALLGAAGEGDIGEHFPPGEPATAGIDSRELLTRVMRLVAARGFRVVNIDATVVAERPRLREHLPMMREALARGLGVDAAAVNLKATTNEGIGEIGAGEAVAALAVALLDEDVP
jgi:2-C-methyl-D-erythritol 2,4-cyclodiphosphate synthase